MQLQLQVFVPQTQLEPTQLVSTPNLSAIKSAQQQLLQSSFKAVQQSRHTHNMNLPHAHNNTMKSVCVCLRVFACVLCVLMIQSDR